MIIIKNSYLWMSLFIWSISIDSKRCPFLTTISWIHLKIDVIIVIPNKNESFVRERSYIWLTSAMWTLSCWSVYLKLSAVFLSISFVFLTKNPSSIAILTYSSYYITIVFENSTTWKSLIAFCHCINLKFESFFYEFKLIWHGCFFRSFLYSTVQMWIWRSQFCLNFQLVFSAQKSPNKATKNRNFSEEEAPTNTSKYLQIVRKYFPTWFSFSLNEDFVPFLWVICNVVLKGRNFSWFS